MTLAPHPPSPPPAPAFPLIPLTVGSLVSRSFTIWTHNLWPLLGFTVLLWIPMWIALVVVDVTVAGLVPGAGGDLWTTRPLLAGAAVAVNVLVPLACWAAWAAGIAHVTMQTLTVGAPAFGSVMGVAARRALPTAGAALLAAPLVLAGTALAVVPGLVVASALAAFVGAATCERLGPVRALRRSWRLTAGHRATLSWTAVVMVLVQLGIAMGSTVVMMVPLLGILLFFFVGLLASPLTVIWTAVAYHDLRVRKEGAATDELGRVFE